MNLAQWKKKEIPRLKGLTPVFLPFKDKKSLRNYPQESYSHKTPVSFKGRLQVLKDLVEVEIEIEGRGRISIEDVRLLIVSKLKIKRKKDWVLLISHLLNDFNYVLREPTTWGEIGPATQDYRFRDDPSFHWDVESFLLFPTEFHIYSEENEEYKEFMRLEKENSLFIAGNHTRVLSTVSGRINNELYNITDGYTFS